jgi:hypothetical protein
MSSPPLSLTEYTNAINERWNDADIERAILHDLPRRFHALPSDEQAALLAGPPPLTGTRWDALLAATAEHLAEVHGQPLPEWLEEPARRLDQPWALPKSRRIRRNAILYAPAAFVRHGALPDPRDLDARGGEHRAWVP